jgi:hypothetical protein
LEKTTGENADGFAIRGLFILLAGESGLLAGNFYF